MNARIGDLAGRGPVGLKDRSLPKRFSEPERRYYAWLHNFPCCLSGRPDVQIAHTGGLAQGKGMGRKAALWTCLPLSFPLHVAEEANREAFWRGAGVDRLPFAERLYGIFEGGASLIDGFALIHDMQAKADRSYLAAILAGPYNRQEPT